MLIAASGHPHRSKLDEQSCDRYIVVTIIAASGNGIPRRNA